MKIKATVKCIEYFDIEVEVPDNATDEEQYEAIREGYYAQMSSPDDSETEIGEIEEVDA